MVTLLFKGLFQVVKVLTYRFFCSVFLCQPMLTTLHCSQGNNLYFVQLEEIFRACVYSGVEIFWTPQAAHARVLSHGLARLLAFGREIFISAYSSAFLQNLFTAESQVQAKIFYQPQSLLIHRHASLFDSRVFYNHGSRGCDTQSPCAGNSI